MVTLNVTDYVLFFVAVGGLFAVIWYFMGVDTGKNRYIGPKEIIGFLAVNRVTKFISRHLLTISAFSFISVGLIEVVIPFTNGTYYIHHYYTSYGTPNQGEQIMYNVSGFSSIFWGAVLLSIGIILVCVKISHSRK